MVRVPWLSALFFAVCFHFVNYAYTLGGDLVALEIEYHFSCLIEYRNYYRSSLHKKNSKSNAHIQKIKAQAFVELIWPTNSALTMLMLPTGSDTNGWCILTLDMFTHIHRA